MSRYRKAQHNEVELKEIDGVTPILRPTRDEIFKAIDLFKEQSVRKSADLHAVRQYLSDLLYNSLFLWEGNKRTEKREEGSEDITKDDIDDYVVKNVFELWGEVLFATNIIDKTKFEELQKKQKEEEEKAKNPN